MNENMQHENTLGYERDGAGIHHPPVTVVGLGMMGSALAQTFLKENHRTTVWNRTADKANALASKGAHVAGTVAEAFEASPVVVICVLDYGVVHEILEQAGDMLAGRIVVNLTNGTPAQARQTAVWAAGRGAEYLDGGIMAVPQMIGTPGSLVLYSGSPIAFQTFRTTLERLGTAKFLGDDPGMAPLYDLALLSAMYGMFGGFFHAVAMVREERIQAQDFTSLAIPWLHAMSASLPRLAQAIDMNDHRTNVSSLYINRTGFDNLISACRELGISTELMTPIQALIKRGVEEGYGADGLSRLVELIRKPVTM